MLFLLFLFYFSGAICVITGSLYAHACRRKDEQNYHQKRDRHSTKPKASEYFGEAINSECQLIRRGFLITPVIVCINWSKFLVEEVLCHLVRSSTGWAFCFHFRELFLLLTLITEIWHFLYPKGSPIAFHIQPRNCWGLGTGTRLPNMLTQIRFEERNQTMVLDGPGQKPDLELAIPTGTDFHYHPSKDLNL